MLHPLTKFRHFLIVDGSCPPSISTTEDFLLNCGTKACVNAVVEQHEIEGRGLRSEAWVVPGLLR